MKMSHKNTSRYHLQRFFGLLCNSEKAFKCVHLQLDPIRGSTVQFRTFYICKMAERGNSPPLTGAAHAECYGRRARRAAASPMR